MGHRLKIVIAALLLAFLGGIWSESDHELSRLEKYTLSLSMTAIAVTLERWSAATKQAALAERGQITGRFTTALELLGSDKQSIRIGAIYALGSTALDLARQGSDDFRDVIDLLCAYAREQHSVRNVGEGPEEGKDRSEIRALASALLRRPGKARSLAPALLRRLGRVQEEARSLDLRGVDLSEVGLNGIDLRRANLNGSHLVRTWLEAACLAGAFCIGANLNYSHLSRASLRNADLGSAKLQFSKLKRADLRGADLRDTDLSFADLRDADLRGVKLGRTKVEGANFTGANLDWREFKKGAKGSRKTKLPDGLEHPDSWE